MSYADSLKGAKRKHLAATPQTKKAAKGQKANSAGGFSFKVDEWTRLRRFLILGSEGGSYYASEKKLTADNVKVVEKCIKLDGRRTVDEIVAISVAARAPKQEPTMFALAMCASAKDDDVRSYALSKLSDVCRTGTHLFMFVDFVSGMRGWGRALTGAVARWYNEHRSLDLQLVKYRQRGGWSHRDLLRLAKPVPANDERRASFAWAVGKEGGSPFLHAADAAQSASSTKLVSLIENMRLPWEAVPSDKLNDPDVLRALLPNMGYTALLRNLNRLTIAKVLTGATLLDTINRLTDPEAIQRSKVHPLQVLLASTTYDSGRGFRGGKTWTPISGIGQALGIAFQRSFANVTPTGKRFMLALDVSGSMTFDTIAGTNLTPRDASAAMALVTAATEPDCRVMAFSTNFVPLNIRGGMSLAHAIGAVSNLPFSGTDCSLPMTYAEKNGLDVDTFVVYTDSETWAGHIHPFEALKRYRQQSGIDAKLVVVGMVSSGFTIADPNDAGMLDVVGFDSATPQIISDFSAGNL